MLDSLRSGNAAPYMLEQLAFNLNTHYTEFLRSSEGIGFSGTVCVVADSVGSILAHDLLSSPRIDRLPMTDNNISVTDIGVRRWREPFSVHKLRQADKQLETLTLIKSPSEVTLCPVEPKKNSENTVVLHPGDREHESESCSRRFALDFQVQNFFMLGSPVGLILAYRHQQDQSAAGTLNSSTNSSPNKVYCSSQDFKLVVDQAYNLFHLTDPCGFRIEPLLDSRFSHVSPVFIPQYVRYPLGDGQSTNLVETLIQQAELFSSNRSDKCFDSEENVNTSVNENSDSTSSVKCQPTDHKYSWEKKSLVALETLKKVRHSWWGPKRVDYSVHCPEAIQNILARARPPILHASYWESKDVSSFIIRQLLETLGLSVLETSYSADMADEIAVTELAKVSLNPDQMKSQVCGMSDDSSTQISQQSEKSSTHSKLSNFGHSLSVGPRSFLKRTSSERLKNFKPNHRANDVIATTGFSDEKIRVEIQSLSGSWAYMCTEVTDSSGRLRFFLPEQFHLPNGFYPIKMIPDSSTPQTEVVVFSVDGSFAASLSLMGKDPKVHPGAVDVARHWQGLGFLLIYLSARPDMQRRRVTNWMANHNFPFGMTFFLNGLYTDPLKQKAQMLRTIVENAKLRVHCGYGSGKDINLYRSLGLSTHNIFLIGKVSRSQASHGTPLSQGYSSHLSSLINGHPLCRPAVGAMSVPVRCCPFDLPSICPSSPLSMKSDLFRNNSVNFSSVPSSKQLSSETE
ncbi:unnamed protein product [Heterobilharzia americana]|nr:unnamed protein product [Heterobilharzia americana]